MATVIDGEGQVMGRLASSVAKRLMAHEEIVIVNADKMVVTGSKDNVYATYNGRRVDLGSPRGKGPYYPRYPDQVVKRAVRGMLPYKKPSGRDAFRRLKVFNGLPKEFQGSEMEKPEFVVTNRRTTMVELGQLAKLLGAKL